jgi:hypothetical protein
MVFFIQQLKTRNEPLFYFGLVCLLAAAVCLVLTKVSQTQVAGTSAWYKPFKFFLSSTIFVWSMGWYLHYLDASNAVYWYSISMILFLGFENVYIIIQAAQGQLSHFNVSTTLYASLWSLMAAAAVGISLWTAVIGIQFFTNDFSELPKAYVWGIRLGLIIFIIFSMQGLAMGARMAHTVGAPDGSPGLPVVNWSKRYGDLRIAHFLGMHALQVLPLVGFYLIKNVRGIIVLGIFYAGIVTFTFIQALMGKPMFKL